MLRLRRLAIGLGAVALGLFAVACSDGVGLGAPDVEVHVSASLNGAPIDTAVVEVTAVDIPVPLLFGLDIVAGSATGTITLPPGAARTLTVRAFDTRGAETHRGAATIDVIPGRNRPVSITIVPVAGHLPLVATLVSVRVTIAPSPTTLEVGDTLRLTATVTDSAGAPLNLPVRWATTAPTIAAVDSTGLVTGVAGGTASIVATAGGATASRGLVVTPVAPRARGFHWINAAGGAWSVPGNWDLNAVPTEIDTAYIDLPATYTVTLDASDTVAVLDLGATSGRQTLYVDGRTLAATSGGRVRGTGDLILIGSTLGGSGPVAIEAGGSVVSRFATVNTPLVNQGVLQTEAVTLNGLLTQQGTFRVTSGTFGLGQATTVSQAFTNSGTVEITAGGNIQTTLIAPQITNAAGATLTTVGPGWRALAFELVNQGTVTIATPAWLAVADAQHVNSGTLGLTTADLTITQSGTTPSFTNTGMFDVPAGRTLVVEGGRFAVGGTIGGTGTLTFQNSATVEATQDWLIANGRTVNVISSTLNGPGLVTTANGATLLGRYTTINASVTNVGLLQTEAVTLTGQLTQLGTFRVTSGTGGLGQTTTLTQPLTNQAVVEVTAGGNIQTTLLAPRITNAVGATLTTVGPGWRLLAFELINEGTVTIATTAWLAVADAQHVNNGTLDVTTGDFQITQTGTTPSFTNTGAFDVLGGRTLTVDGGRFAIDGSLTGAGTLTFQNAVTVQLLSDYVVEPGRTANLLSSALNGPGVALIASGGSLVSRFSTINANVVNQGLLQTEAVTIAGALTQTGTFRVTSGTFGLGQATTVNAAFTNQGTVELTAGGNVQTTLVVPRLTNASGATLSTVGPGWRVFAFELVNAGTVTIGAAAWLAVGDAAHLNTGTLELTSGDFTIAQSGSSPSFRNRSAMVIGAGRTLTVTDGQFLNELSTAPAYEGVITGAGTLTTGLTTFVNNGRVRPGVGGPGILTSNGGIGFAGTATLDLEIGGTTAGTGHDRLATPNAVSISTGATMRVTLVNGFTPTPGDTFTVVTANTVGGSFTNLALPSLPSGSWVVTYTTGSVVLNVVP